MFLWELESSCSLLGNNRSGFHITSRVWNALKRDTHTHICSWQWKLSSILYLFNMAFFHFFHHLSITFPWQSAPGKTPAENFRGGDPKAAIDKQRAAGQDLPTAALAPPKMVPNMCKYCKSSTICGYKNCLGWFFLGVFQAKIDYIV